jgi:class 3 adenylate cyclase
MESTGAAILAGLATMLVAAAVAGDAAAAELAGRLAALVEGISRRNRGRPVRWLGDGGMFVFREPPTPPEPPRGEVLVSRPVADRIPHPNHLEPLGPVELKGVAQPLEVFRAGAGPAARSGPGASRW